MLWTTPPEPTSILGTYRDWGELVAVHEQAHLVHLLRPSRRPWRRIAGRLPSYGALGSGDRSWLGRSMAYLVGSAYLAWLEEREGPDSLRDLWARLTARESRSFEEAFRGAGGFVELAAFDLGPERDPSGGEPPRILTRSTGAALAPEPTPEGTALFFLALDADGFDLRRLELGGAGWEDVAEPGDGIAGSAITLGLVPPPGPVELPETSAYRLGPPEQIPLVGLPAAQVTVGAAYGLAGPWEDEIELWAAIAWRP